MASGIMETFECCSDTDEQLVWAIKILLKWNSSVSHYVTGVDRHDRPFLTLRWSGSESWGGSKDDALPLIAKMTEAEAIAAQCVAWLKAVDWSKLPEPNIDGSVSKGWHVSIQGPDLGNSVGRTSFYDVFTIYPAYTEYHK